MPVETMQFVLSGGATGVLLWLVWRFMDGGIVSRKTHDEIVNPLRETIKEQNAKITTVTAEANEAIKTQAETQRTALEKQNQTIALLHEMIRSQNAGKDPSQ